LTENSCIQIFFKELVAVAVQEAIVQIGNTEKKRDSPSRRSLQENLQQGAGNSGTPPLRGAGATSEPAVEVSTKGRDKPEVRNLPEVLSRTSLPGVSSSNIPAEGEGPRHLASGVSTLHRDKTRLSGCLRQKIKKDKANQAGTGEWKHAQSWRSPDWGL
jgi:hypothetical protein